MPVLMSLSHGVSPMFDQVSFTTKVADIFDANGKRIDRTLGRGIYREDTGELISICGPNHKTVDHIDVLNPILQQITDQGYDLIERNTLTRSALYDLKGKKGCFVSAKVEKNGAVMRTDIITGDFTNPVAGFNRSGTDGNTLFKRITILNSHDGSLAVHVNDSYLRLVCLNGMTTAQWSVNTRAKHTLGLNVNSLREKILRSLEMSANDPETFALYARTAVTRAQAIEYFQRTIARLANDSAGNLKWSEALVQDLLGRFDCEDQTVFGIWNAMTEWATHGTRKANASALGTLLSREQRVATAMRADEFGKLLAA